MIPIATGIRVWVATGHTDVRRGMRGLALQVQEGLGRDPFAGDVYVFRGRNGPLINQGDLARSRRVVAVCQAPGSRTLPVAANGRWRGGTDGRADGRV